MKSSPSTFIVLVAKPMAKPYRHCGESNVEAPQWQQTKLPEKETLRRRWAKIKSETIPPPPHQQHLLYTSALHLFSEQRKQGQNGVLKTLLGAHPNWYGGAGSNCLYLVSVLRLRVLGLLKHWAQTRPNTWYQRFNFIPAHSIYTPFTPYFYFCFLYL